MPDSVKTFAFCVFTAFLFLLLPTQPAAQNNEAELRQKIEASGGKIYRIRAGVPDKDGWYQGESTQQHFKIRLPAPFNDFVIKDHNAVVIESAAVGTATPDGTKWLAMLISYKDPTSAKKFFDEYWGHWPNEAVKQSLNFHGQPAKETWIKEKWRGFASRNILVGNKQYLLTVEYHTPRDIRSDILKFFNSLEFPLAASGSTER